MANKRTPKCWCGCGGEVKRGRRFLPGHDAKFRSSVLRVRRGQMKMTAATNAMPAAAKQEFRKEVKEEVPA